MRAIHSKMVDALLCGIPCKQSNDAVRRIPQSGLGLGLVGWYYHGNLIAWVDRHSDDSMKISFCGWATPSTKERLNHLCNEMKLGRPFHTVRHQLHCNGVAIDPSDSFSVDKLPSSAEPEPAGLF